MRILRFSDFLNEKAVSADEVINDEPFSGVIKVNNKKHSNESLILILYNFKESIVEGYIYLERFKGDKEYMVKRAYAIEKHGPLCYELALSVISPDGIIPDRTIRPGAQKVWEYFDKKRSDVKKTIIGPEHDWYAKEFEVDIEHQHLKNPDVLDRINKIYSVDKPFKNTQELLDRGVEFMNKYNVKEKDIVKKADEDFFKIYNAQFQ